MKFTIVVDPSLVIKIIHFVVLAMLRSREEDFLKKYINFIIFTQKLPPIGVGWGVMKFTISGLLPLYMLLTKFVKIGIVV